MVLTVENIRQRKKEKYILKNMNVKSVDTSLWVQYNSHSTPINTKIRFFFLNSMYLVFVLTSVCPDISLRSLIFQLL